MRYLKRNKYILMALLAILLVGIIIAPTSTSFAQIQGPIKLNREFKMAFLSTPAYYCMEVSSAPLSNKEYNNSSYASEINTYTNLNDVEFKTFAKKRIESLIQLEKSANGNFMWDKEFLEDFIKPLFPTMYSKIINSSNHRGITITNKASSTTVLSNGNYVSQTNIIYYPKTLL